MINTISCIYSNCLLMINSYCIRNMYRIDYSLTYLLTPWSRVLLEKLTGSAASQEIPRIFGTRRFLTVLTSARHLSLSWANSIQSPQLPPTSWRSILILSSHQNHNNIFIFIIKFVHSTSFPSFLTTYYTSGLSLFCQCFINSSSTFLDRFKFCVRGTVHY